MASSKSAATKKRPLTLAQVSAYDDILTDALVDHVYYWTNVPKNRPSYHPSRGVREEEIAKIIQQEVVVKKSLESGEKRLLETDGLRRFLSGLRMDREKDDFRQHLRRYLRIYMPDCPWEVSSTNRYTIVTHEAAVTARRYIKRNETIKYLSGIQVVITPEEEKEISVRKKDFSIVVSSRNKCTSLFMGPARFANHDCQANAKLITTGHYEIEIVATRPIGVGEEITVSYGDNYFGDDNCECLCMTCESELRNGWGPEEGSEMARAGLEEKSENYSLRRRRREDSIGSSRTSSVTPGIRPRIMKTRGRTKLNQDAVDSSRGPSTTPEMMSNGHKRNYDAMATPPITPAKKLKHEPEPGRSISLLQPAETCSRDSSISVRSSFQSANAHETDATSPEMESPEPSQSVETPSKSSKEAPALGSSSTVAVEPVSPQSLRGQVSPTIPVHKASAPAKSIVRPALSPMSLANILNEPYPETMYRQMQLEVDTAITPSIEVIEIEQEVKPKPPRQTRKYQRRVFVKQPTPPARGRVRGDYLLTPLLLSEPDMAWIQCTNCTEHFVQQNAYFTRSACPRCERHSKLYGYAWPKTDKTSPSDKEERILDHRTIHRFLDPNDERRARGRKLVREEAQDRDESTESERSRHANWVSGRAGGKKQEEQDTAGVRRSGRMRRVSSRLSDVMAA